MPKINRPHSIVVKVTADERDAITRLALKEKLTAANWLRSLGMAKVMSVPNPDYVSAIDDGVLVTFKSNGDVATVSDMGNPITDTPPFKARDYSGKVEFKNGDLVAPVPKEWGTIQPAADAPKPMPAEQRMYQLIASKQGQAAADAWIKSRQKPKAEPAPEIVIPQHLRAFYESVLKNQGEGAAKLWIANNTGGVKLTP